MPDREERQLNRLERKDLREQRKVAKEQMKDYSLGQDIKSEMGKYGIDPDKIGPVSGDAKKRITESAKKLAGEDLVKDVESFAEGYKHPEKTPTPTLDQEKLKQQLKREKRARIIDAISAIGRGMQGKEIDPSRFLSSQIRSEREKQYEQFRNVSEANKKISEQWQNQYRNDLLDFIDQKLKDNKTSALEKEKMRQLKSQVELTQARTAREKARMEWENNKPYYKPTTTQTSKGPVYEYKTKDGQKITIPVSGAQESLQFAFNIEEANTLRQDIDDLIYQRDQEIKDAWRESSKQRIRESYADQINDLETKLNQVESSIKSFGGSQETQTEPTGESNQNSEQTQSNNTTFNNILNKYK